MRRIPAPLLLLLTAAVFLPAQAPLASTWETATELPDVDFSGLTAVQKKAALKLIRETGCSCGCDMKVAQCRIQDPPCTYSKGIAGLIVSRFKEGNSAEEVAKMVKESAIAKPREPQKILEDPVQISTAGNPSKGPETARLVLIEFSDFECPYCAQAAAQVHQILAAYPKDIRLIYKQFPLSMHPNAPMAALASLAAAEQGKFWELHDKMFANFRQLSRDNVVAWAKQLGMDTEKFKTAMDSAKNKTLMEKDLKDGEFAGVNGTPSIYINGKHFNGPISLAALKPILDEELKTAHPASRP